MGGLQWTWILENSAPCDAHNLSIYTWEYDQPKLNVDTQNKMLDHM